MHPYYTRRKRGHDYTAPGQYHIILKKNPEFPSWGKLVGDPDIPLGQPGEASIKHNLVGKIIGSKFFNLNKKFPFLISYQYMVMPDHVHAYIRVLEKMEKHLGYYINGVKMSVCEEWSLKANKKFIPQDIFQFNYTDKVIYTGRDFKEVIDYIKENPQRLGFRLKYKDFYERRRGLLIGGIPFECYGNIQLLQNPFKEVVRAHRNDTEEDRASNMEACLYHSGSGGIIVSPFIHSFEKAIRKECEQLGGRTIFINQYPFTEKYKPYKYDFYRCKEGKLLIIAPKDDIWAGKMCKNISNQMNRVAELICEGNYILHKRTRILGSNRDS